MTAKELQRTEAAYRMASRRAEKLREARNTLVQAALAEGWTHARISETTGLSRGRISQIAGQKDRAAWALDLICCGRDQGSQGCRSSTEADEFRAAYLDAEGHDRQAIKRHAIDGEPIGWHPRKDRETRAGGRRG